MNRVNKIAACLLLVFLAACSSTYITSSWKAPDARARVYNKLLVLGVMGNEYLAYRQQMEQALTEDLTTQGINAISALGQYGQETFQKLTEQQVNERMKKKGFDGVITISLLSAEREVDSMPGNLYYTPLGYDYRNFWDDYSTVYGDVYNPDYYVENDNYYWESNLYDLHTGRLVYSVESQSFNPKSAQNVGLKYGKLIMSDLIKNGLIRQNATASR